ncbi:hypothetical protein [Coleofasciculus sp. F4-SAH-05]|uniref:hypothetical protein n=1 Tax=Coleofasciculus sp. F4-SAH-05 TaxID=3069525 RepID=UPI0032F5C77F
MKLCLSIFDYTFTNYYWQYRAAVSIDGVKRPVEIYNCRDRTRVRQDGVVVSFEPDGAGEFICSFF